MIHYMLLCEQEHEFDSWFDSSAAYEKLQKAHLVECPHCGSTHIRKALMSPQIGANSSGKSDRQSNKQADCSKAALQQARKLRDHIKENAENVGENFAEEARKIHFEEVEVHNIYGKATGEEVRELIEEGVDFAPLPDLPEDKN